MENLTKAVQDLETQVGRLGRSFGRRTWALAVIAVCMVAVVAIAGWVQASNDSRIRESEQKWCPIVSLMIPRPGDPPPTTDRGRLLEARAADLARQFHCPPNGA